MVRGRRVDEPGDWHHVMNRGVGRRPIFQGRSDVRFFLALVARVVRRRELELHAYVVLSTHYHLLVRSPGGTLSLAMGWIGRHYATRFNRQRDRDGPVFRGRFRSKLVDNEFYRGHLPLYIHDNPVAARLVTSARDYPWSSARAYEEGSGPRWLTLPQRDHERSTVRARTPTSASFETIAATDERTRRRAWNADGARALWTIVEPDVVLDHVEGIPLARTHRRCVTAWLLRSLSGLTNERISARLGVGATTVRRDIENVRLHRSSEPRIERAVARAYDELLRPRSGDLVPGTSPPSDGGEVPGTKSPEPLARR